MTLTEMLIASASDIKTIPEKELEVSRLSAKLGQPCKMKVRALTLSEYSGLPKGDDMRVHLLIKGTITPELKDEKLRRAFTPKDRKNPLTTKELVSELFLVGEIANIASEILALSGFSEDSIRSIESLSDVENAAADEVLKN